MTETEAREWVDSHSDDDELDDLELAEAFLALYGREPDQDDYDVPGGLWSLCCCA